MTARTRTGSTPYSEALRSIIRSYGERRFRCFASQRRSAFRPEDAPPKFEIIFFPSFLTITCNCAEAFVTENAAMRRTAMNRRIAVDGSTAQNRVMSFALIQKDVDRYINQFKEGYFPPLSMLARLTEELGELARALSH